MEQHHHKIIYLAGGCFWGMEKLMQSIPGVLDAQSGYANGTWAADADYKTLLLADPDVKARLSAEALDELCRPENSYTHIDEIFDRNPSSTP